MGTPCIWINYVINIWDITLCNDGFCIHKIDFHLRSEMLNRIKIRSAQNIRKIMERLCILKEIYMYSIFIAIQTFE